MADISIRMTADGSAVVSAVQQASSALQSLGVQAAQASAALRQIQPEAALQGLSTQARQASSALRQTQDASAGLHASLLDLLKAGVVFGALSGMASSLVNAMGRLPGSGIAFAAQIEVSRVGMAGVLASMTSMNGQATSYAKGLEIASTITAQLQRDAMMTAASTQELVTAFQALVGPGLAAGMTLDQIRQFSTVGVNAVKSMGLGAQQIVQELRDLVQGGITASSSTLATALGLKDADIAKAKASSEGLFTFLMERMKGFAESGPAYAKTFTGVMDQLHEQMLLSSAKVFEPLANALKESAQAIGKAISNESNVQAMQQMAGGIATVAQALGSAGKFAIDHAQSIGVVVQAYLTLKVSMLAAGWLASAAAMLEASAASRLLSAQTAVESVANTEAALTTRQKIAAYLAELEAKQAATAATLTLTTARVAELRAAVLAAEGAVALAITTNGLVPAMAAQAAATEAAALATTQLGVAQRAASVSGSAFGSVIGALGGPVGVAILAVASLVGWMISMNSEATKSAKLAISKDRVDAAVAGGGRAESRDTSALEAAISQLKDRRDELLANKGVLSFLFGADYESGMKNQLSSLDAQITSLQTSSTAATAAASNASTAVQLNAAGATKTLDGLLEKEKTATSLRKKANEEAAALDAELKKIQSNSNVSADVVVQKEQAVAEAKKAIATKLNDELKKINTHGMGEAQTLANAHYAVLKASADQQAAYTHQRMVSQEIDNQLQYTQGLKSESEYHAQKLALNLQSNAAEQAANQSKIDAETARLNQRQTGANRDTVQAALIALQTKQIELQTKAITLNGAETERVAVQASKHYSESLSAKQKETQSVYEQIDKEKEHLASLGLTKEAIGALALARLEDKAITQDQLAIMADETDKTGNLGQAYRAAAQALRELGVLKGTIGVKEEVVDAAKKAEEAWASANKSIGDGLYSALANGGDSALKKLLKDAKEWFARLVLSPIVQPIAALGASIMNPTAASAGAGGFGNLASLGGAAYQAITGASVGASSASLAIGNTVGVAGGDALGAMIAANGGWAGVSTAAGGAAAAGGATVAGGAAAGAAAGSAFASAIPYIGAAVLAYSLLTQDHGTPTSNTGSTARAFDAAGKVTGSESYYGGTSAGADAMIVKMQDAYMQGAKSLGIATVASNFNFSGNTGKNGESPNFALGGGAGGKSFQQGETKLDDAAVALAASRAVFAALQGSELPVYLAGVFDHLSAGAATQEQITAALAGAQALATWHTALTALPFDSLTNASYSTMQGLIGAAGGLDKLSGNLSGFYANFYSSDEKTAALTKSTTAAFADLGLVMPALDASTRANYRSMIEELGAKDLSVAANAKAYTGALALQGAVNELAPAMSAAKSSIKDLAKEMTGFDAAGLGKMILDAAFNPQAGMTAAESFAQALQYSVQNALISSTVGQISDMLYTSIIMPIVAGNAVAQGAMDAVVADATAKLTALGQLFESDTFKSAIGSIAQTVAGIMPSLTPLQQYTAPVAYVAPVVDTKAADEAKAAADALAQSLKSLGDTSKSLAIELLRAQGQQAQADAAQRAIDIAGYSAAEIAVYDYNASLRAQITAIGAAKTATEALVTAENAATAAREAAVQKSFDVTSAGAKTALDALSRAVDAEKKLVTTAYESASKTTQTALDKITASAGKLQALATSLKGALDGMRIIGSDGAYRAGAQAQISAALATARAGGSLPVAGELTSALATVAKPSEQLFGSFTEYALDFYRTANDISDLSALTSDALSADETTQLILQQQLVTIKAGYDAETSRLDAIVTGATAQLNALNGINTSVLSVAAALADFAASMGAATTAAAALAAQKAAAALAAQKAAVLAATPVFDSSTKSDVVGQIQAAASAGGITQEMQLYQTATSSGYTAAQVDKSMGWAPGTSNAWAAEKGLPTFAIGTNFVPTDMTANIHAGERIIPAADNRELMQRLQSPSDNNAVLVAEIRALRAEVAGLRASSERGNESAQRTADTLSGRQGVPFLVQMAV